MSDTFVITRSYVFKLTFFERPTKSPDKHYGMLSIDQMHPLLHNGQSWMHTRATKPLVSGKTRPLKDPLR
ncbi:hypothetical protein Hanom_Chr13g01200821 [Helianthus anomalus]